MILPALTGRINFATKEVTFDPPGPFSAETAPPKVFRKCRIFKMFRTHRSCRFEADERPAGGQNGGAGRRL